MQLWDLFTLPEWYSNWRRGMVFVKHHPSLPLALLCYSKSAVVEQHWNRVTEQCRGLVFNTETGEIVARPFRKFYNHNEPRARIDFDAAVEVTDKVDGSLGIVYNTPDGPAIATKGSFTSDQALYATNLLRTKYPDWSPPDGITVMVEIVYPENRIVVDYGEMEDLVFLGAIHNQSGRDYVLWADEVPFVHNQSFHYGNLIDALGADPRPNSEGFVVRYKDTDQRIKIKQQDYLDKHKMVFLLSERTVWESLRNDNFTQYMAEMPDEFHEWMLNSASKFSAKFQDYMSIVDDCYFSPDFVVLQEWWEEDRHTAGALMAGITKSMPNWVSKALWCLMDGIDHRKIIWNQFEPHGKTEVAKW